MEPLHQLAWQKRTGKKDGYSLLMRCSIGQVKAAVNRFDKELVASRYNEMYHTFQSMLTVEGWHKIEAVRRAMDLDGFEHKLQLYKRAMAGEGAQGVTGA
jgi:hypothetical protein